jgi:hypothetical protein
MSNEPENFGDPADSHLRVAQMFTIVTQLGDNPPQMELTLDVKHDENPDIGWRVSVHLTREQIIELTCLMVNACENNNLPIRPDGTG